MTIATEVKKLTETKAFYAITGAGDFAVEKLRELPDQITKLQTTLQTTAAERARTVDARAYAATLQGKAETYAKDLPEKSREYTDAVQARLVELYEELATRGRKVVSRASGEAALELQEVSETAEPAIATQATTRKPATRKTSATKA